MLAQKTYHSVPSLDLADTSPDHWKYLSEGGATLVFSYAGPQDERFHNKVLRLGKNNSVVEDEDSLILFQTEVISRLVLQKNLAVLETVLLSSSWLESLSSLCKKARPDWRTGDIDTNRTKGFLAPNLVSSPISVEIKASSIAARSPKWSFLRPGLRTCRFCMHSSCRGWITSYCPLDLFSSSPARIKNALYALYDAWADGAASQNNFRLFADGRLMSPDDLLSALRGLGMLHSSILEEKGIRELVVETLLVSFIKSESLELLKTLKNLQRTLDGLGIEGLASLWDSVHSLDKTSFGGGFPQPTIDDWRFFVTEYLEPQGCSVPAQAPSGETQLQYNILSYLLSATFKDCSMMIMLPGLLHESLPISLFPSRITLIDLDPKRVERLQKWLEQDRNIIQEYTVSSQTNSEKRCVDV
ncbi:inositol-pentakisphosphate 2-kinase [Lentinula aff. lateritia]|uniref:Inositol-pentakisphosphate 2-kinase n=1 Tax=Lentinula aff. lateritia TaxID=2804960 RepID=A0ACC1UDW2_9AGAR|nr:inositol-pentakisphosphate 2-kinase [Lentinula aff. lateritia]